MDAGESYLKTRLSNILGKIRSNEIVSGIILSVIVGVIAGLGAIVFRWLIRHHGFPVVDEDENFCGVVTLSDVEEAMSKGNPEGVTVNDIASKSVVVVHPDQYLHDVLVKLGA